MSQMQPYDPQSQPVQHQGQPLAASAGLQYPANRGPLTDRREPAGVVLAIAWILAVLTLGYLLPWAIAATRGKSNQAAIGILNFLLGWTFIGWLVAIVMACLPHQIVTGGTQTVIVTQQFATDRSPEPGQAALPQAATPLPPAGWYPHPVGGQRYWDGMAWTEHTAP